VPRHVVPVVPPIGLVVSDALTLLLDDAGSLSYAPVGKHSAAVNA